MSNQAIGMIETRGLIALVEGTDAMLKAANVTLAGPMKQVGNALVSAVVVGDVVSIAGHCALWSCWMAVGFKPRT